MDLFTQLRNTFEKVHLHHERFHTSRNLEQSELERFLDSEVFPKLSSHLHPNFAVARCSSSKSSSAILSYQISKVHFN